ncbi:MAG TPA: DMT family transporter [Candidatus Saccharimonadia bacterium]|nr:DMT family transporter [Candidatus Saccharimonadia bacterium]
MLWILLLSIHLIGIVGYALYLRKSALSSIDKTLLAALMQTAVFLPSLALAAYSGVNLHLQAWQWGSLLLNGLFIVGIQFFGIMALKYLEASVFTIIFSLRLLFTTILGLIFLGELPTQIQLLGGFIIFASIIALNLHRERRYASRPIVYGVLITLFFSLHATLEKFNIVNVGFMPYIVISGGIATAILWIIVYRRRIRLPHVVAALDGHTLQLLVLRTMSAWGYLLALKYGSLAVTNYVSGMSVPLTVLFGIFILRERTQLREKITATLIALAGLTLILLGRLTGH